MSKALLWSSILPLALVGVSGLRPMVVQGSSMSPTLHPGQVALLDRNYYHTHPLARGDVVVFRWKDQVYVKRVYALSGETVMLLGQDGYDTPVAEESVPRALRLKRRWPRFTIRYVPVPPDHIFTLGDYPTASVDSRQFGPIPVTAILGRVQVLWGSPLPTDSPRAVAL